MVQNRQVTLLGDSILKGIQVDLGDRRYRTHNEINVEALESEFQLPIHNDAHFGATVRKGSRLLDRLLENMGDAELNAKMKALTDEKESLKAQILDTQQMEVSLEEQAARHQQMWDSIMECSAGYTEFDDEFVRQIIQKITVEDEETIRIHFRDSEMVMEQEL